MSRILFVVHRMSSRAGSQRALVKTSNSLAQYGHKVSVAIFEPVGSAVLYDFHPDIEVIQIGKKASRLELINQYNKHISPYWNLRKLVLKRNFDTVVGWTRRLGCMVALLPRKQVARKVAALRTAYLLDQPQGGFWAKRAINKAMNDQIRKCDLIVVQSKSLEQVIPAGWDTARAVIPNSLSISDLPLKDLDDRPKKIVAISRLVGLKRLDALILAMVEFRKQYPDWSLDIWGDGRPKYRQYLEELIEEQGVEDVVRLCGVTDKLDEALSNARMLVHPSREEGMANAVLEAMAHRVPAIGCDDCLGMSEILVDGHNGILLPKARNLDMLVEQLLAAMVNLAQNTARASALGQAGQDDIRKHFGAEEITQKWVDALCPPA